MKTFFGFVNVCFIIFAVTAGCNLRESAPKTDWRERLEKLANEKLSQESTPGDRGKERVEPVPSRPLPSSSTIVRSASGREFRLVGNFQSHFGPRYEQCVAQLTVDKNGEISGVICYGTYKAEGRQKPCNGRVRVSGEVMSDKVAYITITEVVGSWPSQLPNGVGVVLKGRLQEDRFIGDFVDPDRGNYGVFDFDVTQMN